MEDEELSEGVRAANRNLVEDLIRLGWRRNDDGMVAHPTIADFNVWLNPYSDEILISPELVKFLKEINQPWVTALLQFLSRR